MFEKANSGMVFESLYLLVPQTAPVSVIVASDGSFQGNITLHPLYCESHKSLFAYLSPMFSAVSDDYVDLTSNVQ